MLSGLALLPRPQPVLATLSLTNQGDLGMAAVRDEALAWGDYDGDLDFLLSGRDSSSTRYVRFSRSNTAEANGAP